MTILVAVFLVCVLAVVHPYVTYPLSLMAVRSLRPKPLKPGQFYDVTVELNEIAQTVPAGYRLRLAISTSY